MFGSGGDYFIGQCGHSGNRFTRVHTLKFGNFAQRERKFTGGGGDHEPSSQKNFRSRAKSPPAIAGDGCGSMVRPGAGEYRGTINEKEVCAGSASGILRLQRSCNIHIRNRHTQRQRMSICRSSESEPSSTFACFNTG